MFPSVRPLDLSNDLKRINSLEDSRIVILYLNLYIEYFVNAICKVKFKEEVIKCEFCGNYKELKFKEKVSKLTNLGFLNKENKHDEVVYLIYRLRNKLLHNLNPDIEELKSWIQEHEPDLKEKSPLVTNFLNNASPWVKIQLFAFPAIVKLYEKYEIEIGNKPKQTIIFEINPDGTVIAIKIIEYQ